MVALFSTTAAHGVCFQDAASYNEVKKQLPSLLQKLPLIIGTETKNVAVAVKIQKQGEKFLFQGGGRLGNFPQLGNPTFLKEACVKGDLVTITLANGKTEKITLSQKSVKVVLPFAGETVLSPISSKTFNKMIAELSPAQSANTRSPGAQ